ncbi:uncharacterized protein B0T15DRAFT_576386 [Chaetomium strumarium]|uniref:Uncharacterized protein n=1 Tax=Chaetomium strumarium TaxID=1170767 RepID=A0AAJ0GN20_9PEZI|nr:hypothetical protein B0T15DRAFT_576386 [Chaetomium strumarium]
MAVWGKGEFAYQHDTSALLERLDLLSQNMKNGNVPWNSVETGYGDSVKPNARWDTSSRDPMRTVALQLALRQAVSRVPARGWNRTKKRHWSGQAAQLRALRWELYGAGPRRTIAVRTETRRPSVLKLVDDREVWTVISPIVSLDARFQLLNITTNLHPDMDSIPLVALWREFPFPVAREVGVSAAEWAPSRDRDHSEAVTWRVRAGFDHGIHAVPDCEAALY